MFHILCDGKPMLDLSTGEVAEFLSPGEAASYVASAQEIYHTVEVVELVEA